MLEQILSDMALGLTMHMVFADIIVAGELIGLQMGFFFASFLDPASGGNTSVMAWILNTVALLICAAVNGHLIMIAGLARTFEMLPVDGLFSI